MRNDVAFLEVFRHRAWVRGFESSENAVQWIYLGSMPRPETLVQQAAKDEFRIVVCFSKAPEERVVLVIWVSLVRGMAVAKSCV